MYHVKCECGELQADANHGMHTKGKKGCDYVLFYSNVVGAFSAEKGILRCSKCGDMAFIQDVEENEKRSNE